MIRRAAAVVLLVGAGIAPAAGQDRSEQEPVEIAQEKPAPEPKKVEPVVVTGRSDLLHLTTGGAHRKTRSSASRFFGARGTLTLTLSLRERGTICLPLPAGEGRGEG